MGETRHRARPMLSDEDMHTLYDRDWGPFAQPERDAATVELGKTLDGITSIADMSCGGAGVTPELGRFYGVVPTLGDFGNVYGYPYTGTLQETVPQLGVVDLFVCTETIEHLDDPDADLKLISEHCRNLLLSTPIWEEPEVVSHGHLWTWRQADVEEMLEEAGFTLTDFVEISIFGIWLARTTP